ncbi:hypothetical protein NM208_g9718 [Fusarium decemcellulare]|uniref:Uncharacterized protein n=1 Tax=Fusarium decemcellulare TaxID=57161 RepID=A0ACC1S0I3_9HYPO|nr:hypothetical protein NM208_g9718 [Fusarium decemcellulare]
MANHISVATISFISKGCVTALETGSHLREINAITLRKHQLTIVTSHQRSPWAHAPARMAREHSQDRPPFTADESGDNEPKRRAFHNKVRTGCKTCKIRRIRCDEGKPSCKRCLSTGRNCDGYGISTSHPRPSATITESLNDITHVNASADLRLLGTQRCPNEVRSFRFFMEVAAPSLAGALQTDFWLREVPQVCLADPAIWHAAVSLGSSHEGYVLRRPPGPNSNSFTIKHFNMAIGALTRSSSNSDLWRALTVSIIFTCICVLDGQLDQSRLHFRSGCNLLRALETATIQPRGSDTVSKYASTQIESRRQDTPVSIASMRSMLVSFQMLETKLDRMKISTPPSFLSENDNYSYWRSYTGPRSLACGRYLSGRNLSQAVLAVESLFYTLAIDCLTQAKDLREIYAEKGLKGLPRDGLCQEDRYRGFNEINRTIRLFKDELESCPGPPIRPVELLELRKAYLSLCVLQSTNRLLLIEDPDIPNPDKRIASLPTLCKKIVDMAEEVFGLESTVGCLRTEEPICAPTIVNPLIAVVKWGFGRENRQRARRLLDLPRLEGLWDFRMVAHMSDAMLEREARATNEYSQQQELDGVYIPSPTARGWKPGAEDERAIHPLARMCNSSLHHIAARKVKLTLRTWKEWLEDHPGEDTIIVW